MSRLYIMIGTPGSGKSSLAREMEQNNVGIWISRDYVRKTLNSQNKKCPESQVYLTYCKAIEKTLSEGNDVVADATQLTEKRRKAIIQITRSASSIEYVFVDTPLNLCLQRNSQRIQEDRVPDKSLISMFYSLQKPRFEENRKITKIHVVSNIYPYYEHTTLDRADFTK